MTLLGLREAAKRTHLARGWLALMVERGVIPHTINSADQPRVRLSDVKAHQQAIKDFTTQQRLEYLLSRWTRYGDIRQALPSLSASKLRKILASAQEREYTNYGKKGKEYKNGKPERSP